MNKKHTFDPETLRLAEFADALSHPARVAILKTLAERNTCVCGEIVDVLPLAQSTVSQHLKELKRIGLVQGEISGPKSCYCINREAWETLSSEFASFINSITDSVSAQSCC